MRLGEMPNEAIAADDIERIVRAPLHYRQNEVRTLKDQLKAIIEAPGVAIVSFDCFDTLIKRRASRPVEIFDRIGEQLRSERLLPSYVDNRRFSEWRTRAEIEARKKLSKSGSHEVNLSQIYDELEELAGGAIAVKDFLKFELMVEKDNMFFNHDMIELVDYARKMGKRVIVVSDTYYSQGELKLITGLGATGKIDRFYVSSEYGRGKGDGLFDIILKEESVEPAAIFHIGDNYEADVVRATARGIRNQHVPNGSAEFWKVMQQELLLPTLERRYWETSGIGRWHAHLTPIRTLGPLLDEAGADASYFSFGYTVLGPVLFGYLKWIQKTCSELGNPPIFGLLREGGFIASLYRIIEPEAHVQLLALSRKTLNQMALVAPSYETFNALLSVRKAEKAEDFLAKIGLAINDLPEHLRGVSVPGTPETPALYDYLLEDQKLRNKVSNFGKQVSADFAAYVEKALDATGRAKNVVVLDLGWAASIQRKIGNHDVFKGVQTLGLYLALNNRAFENLATSNIAGYLVNGFDAGEVEDLFLRYVEILEQSCTPDIGSTLGYLDAKSTHAENTTTVEQTKQIAMIQAGIMDFISRAEHAYPVVDVDALREAALRVVTRFTFSPTEAEKTMFRDWSHDDSIIDTHEILTPDYLEEIAPYMHPLQILEGNFLYYYWPQGARAYGNRNTDLLHILPFGVRSLRDEAEQRVFAEISGITAPGRVPSTSSPVLNGDGLFYVHFPSLAADPSIYISVKDSRGFFAIDSLYFFVNKNGSRIVRQTDRSKIQIIDAEHATLISHYDGQVMTSNGVRNILFKIDLPSFPGENIEAISLCCAGAIQTSPNKIEQSPDFELHVDTFAGASVVDQQALEEGIDISGQMTFEGWAYDKCSLTAAEMVLLRMEFTDETAEGPSALTYHSETVLRPDVAQKFRKIIDFNIGFRFVIPRSDVNRRAFRLYLMLRYNGAWVVKPLIQEQIFLANAGRLYLL
jgi:FMN phosphatase YigB (HAD superfamily)